MIKCAWTEHTHTQYIDNNYTYLLTYEIKLAVYVYKYQSKQKLIRAIKHLHFRENSVQH